MRPDRGSVQVGDDRVTDASELAAPGDTQAHRYALPEQRALRSPDRRGQHRLSAASPLRPARGRGARTRGRAPGVRFALGLRGPAAGRPQRRTEEARRRRAGDGHARARSCSTTSRPRVSTRSRRRRSSICSAPSSESSGATVVMVSSDLDRLLTVTDRVGMMYRGELIFDGTTEEARVVRGATRPAVRARVDRGAAVKRLVPLVLALAACSKGAGRRRRNRLPKPKHRWPRAASTASPTAPTSVRVGVGSHVRSDTVGDGSGDPRGRRPSSSTPGQTPRRKLRYAWHVDQKEQLVTGPADRRHRPRSRAPSSPRSPCRRCTSPSTSIPRTSRRTAPCRTRGTSRRRR